MNIFHAHYEFLKNESDRLLKHAQLQLGPSDPSNPKYADPVQRKTEAIQRFRSLPMFHSLTPDDEETIASMQLKTAFNVIAIENGYQTWTELKNELDQAAVHSTLAVINDQFYPKGLTTYWNIWFAKYSQAKKVLAEGKGYLLPYKHQYFIVEEHFVDSIGLPHTLPEWQLIRNDWIHPGNVKAWLALNSRYESVIAGRS